MTDQNYKVLARKYRPSTFDDLIGQEPMVRTLQNAFETNRIAQAYMLTGVRGVGKTTTARILARALNYQTNDNNTPTLDIKNNGMHCDDIMDGTHVDVIEMDAASHTGIGDVREIIASLPYKPVSARYKVYIIDEVHMLSTAAFNGLLKTLEEPPEHVKFIFATTEIRKVPVTVLSRCQRFDLRRIETTKMINLLNKITNAENVSADNNALAMIARAGEGSARDAISLLDQAIAHTADKKNKDVTITEEQIREMIGLADRTKIIDLFEYLMKGDVNKALDEVKEQYDKGAEPAVILEDLAQFTHLVTRLKYVKSEKEDNTLTEDEKNRGKEFAEKLSPRILGRTWQMITKGINETQNANNPIAAADMVIVRIAHAAELPTPDEIIKKITENQKQNNNVNGTSNASNEKQTNQNNPKPVLLVDNENNPEINQTIKSFEELIKIAEKNRDLKFSNMLRSEISLVSFEPKNIEIKIVGDVPNNVVQTIKQKIYQWSGEEWNITISQNENDGELTIKQKEKNQKQELREEAKNDPIVSAVLNTFENSEITDVRPKKETEQDNKNNNQNNDQNDNQDDNQDGGETQNVREAK